MCNRSPLSAYVCATLLFLALTATVPRSARAGSFQPVNPDELKMTSEPLAPGAPAIILDHEVNRNDFGRTSHGGLQIMDSQGSRGAYEDEYFRVKILTEEGRKYAEVEIPIIAGHHNISDLQARTIRPDGSIIVFDGQVFEKTIYKRKGFTYQAKTFTLPDVQVGSIIEYHYTINFDDWYVATLVHPKLGRLLFFDPTDEVTPFGRIRGQLQANNGLLVGPDGGELIQLPKESPALTGIRRSAALVLNPDGTLEGKVVESRIGNRALEERMRLRAASSESDKAKLVEGLLSDSLGTFQITKSEFTQVNDRSQPLGLLYAFQAPGYGRNAGDMLLVRPRVVGSKSSGLLETDQARLLPIEFPSPELDSDDFRITIPPGYEVVDLSPPVDADYGFASYHSRTEFKNNVLRYKRTFEIRDVTVPASQAAELKRFYRIIATDERSTVILKRTVQAQAP